MIKETIIAMTVVTVAAGAALPAVATDVSKPIVVAACNPRNPCVAKTNPCNPCAAKANPCNPCAAKKNMRLMDTTFLLHLPTQMF